MVITVIRILTALLSCILIGLPIAGIAGLKQFLLQHGIYEDECRAGISDWDRHAGLNVHWRDLDAGFDTDLKYKNNKNKANLGLRLDSHLKSNASNLHGQLAATITGHVDYDARPTQRVEGIGGDIGGGIGGDLTGGIGDIIGSLGGGIGGGVGGHIGRTQSQPTGTSTRWNDTKPSHRTSEDGHWTNTWWTNTWWTPSTAHATSKPTSHHTSARPSRSSNYTYTNTWATKSWPARPTVFVEQVARGGNIDRMSNTEEPNTSEPPLPSKDPKYGLICMARMIRFDTLISLGLLAQGVATALAYFVLDYIGRVSGSVMGCLLVAGGTYVNSVPEIEQLFESIDRLYWGYILVCLGSPFVVVSAIDSASVVKSKPIVVLFLLFASIELGGSFWTVWIRYFEPQIPTELFNQYLWVPCVLTLVNLAMSPFTNQEPAGNLERLLKKVSVAPVNNSKDYLSDVSQFLWPDLAYPSISVISRQLKSLWFWLFTAYYTVNILTFDMFFASGVEYAWILDGRDISYEFLYIRPVLSFVTVFIVYILVVHAHIRTILAFIFVSSLTLLTQVLQLTGHWRTVAVLIGPSRVGLDSLCLGFTLKLFGVSSFGVLYSTMMIISAVMDLILPTIVSHLWLSEISFQTVMSTVCVSTLLMAAFMVLKLHRESRRIMFDLLRQEALAAEPSAREIPSLV